MITDAQLIEIGSLLKPHGFKGEITFDPLYDIDLSQLKCIVLKIEGINIPFFIENVRTKGSDQFLVKIEDIDSDKKAASIARREVYALKEDVDIDEDIDEGYSALDFIGYTVIDDVDNTTLGIIEDIDNSTDNWLFKVKPINAERNDKVIFIPVADEFITSVDIEERTIGMTLPQGLVSLN